MLAFLKILVGADFAALLALGPALLGLALHFKLADCFMLHQSVVSQLGDALFLKAGNIALGVRGHYAVDAGVNLR
jgi:hypothetical protein